MKNQENIIIPGTVTIDYGPGVAPVIIHNVLDYKIINYRNTIVRLTLADKTIDFNMDKIFSIEYEEATKK